MPSQAEHLQQARANLAHARRLLETFPEDATAMQWTVTAAFYCAVHCIEAHLAIHNRHSASHLVRRRLMLDPQLGVPVRVYTAYRQLEDWSRGARYEMQQFTADKVRRVVLDQYLGVVTSFVKL